MLTLLAKLLKALNSETSPWALAMAMVLGMFLGLTPLWRVHNLIILLAALIFRVNLTLFLLSFAIFSGIAYLLDPMFHEFGLVILQAQSWQGIYEAMYATAVGRVSQFYHTLTMGSFVFSLIISPVIALATYFIVVNYRKRIQKALMKFKIVQMVKGSRFWQLYMDLRG
ncbi:MAG: TIGR03546 family protein [Pseudomonadota bacterium]